jgi:hypothetical protein
MPPTIPWIGFVLLIISLASSVPELTAQEMSPHDWAEGTPGRDDGATRDYYNRAGRLAWRNFLGDWHDASNQPQGDQPFAQITLTRRQLGQVVEWDVSELIKLWPGGEFPNQGLLIRRLSGSGDFHFHSRDHADEETHPQLLLGSDRETWSLAPVADTHLEPSTYRCMGNAELLRVGGRNHSLLRFDLDGIPDETKIETALLRMHVGAVFGSGDTTLGLFRCSQGHDDPDRPVEIGLAARYTNDQGIDQDPSVLFACDFESEHWQSGWSHVGERRAIEIVKEDRSRKFQPLVGAALRVRIAEGANGALNTIYKFGQQAGEEPEEIFLRYYLRLADDWNQSIEGGKMPGLSGTYGRSGWGGRRSDGTTGWSARGAFHPTIPEGNPLAGLHPLGTYCYHADMEGRYGDIWLWQLGYRGFLENNRWYCIEQYVKLNQPSENDGILRAWIDGRLAFEKTDLAFRRVEDLKIEQAWMNVYHGGQRPSPYDQHMYIDHVVIARQYIGLLGE